MPGVELKGGNSPREFYFILFYFYVMNDEFAHIMYLMPGYVVLTSCPFSIKPSLENGIEDLF